MSFATRASQYQNNRGIGQPQQSLSYSNYGQQRNFGSQPPRVGGLSIVPATPTNSTNNTSSWKGPQFGPGTTTQNQMVSPFFNPSLQGKHMNWRNMSGSSPSLPQKPMSTTGTSPLQMAAPPRVANPIQYVKPQMTPEQKQFMEQQLNQCLNCPFWTTEEGNQQPQAFNGTSCTPLQPLDAAAFDNFFQMPGHQGGMGNPNYNCHVKIGAHGDQPVVYTGEKSQKGKSPSPGPNRRTPSPKAQNREYRNSPPRQMDQMLAKQIQPDQAQQDNNRTMTNTVQQQAYQSLPPQVLRMVPPQSQQMVPLHVAGQTLNVPVQQILQHLMPENQTGQQATQNGPNKQKTQMASKQTSQPKGQQSQKQQAQQQQAQQQQAQKQQAQLQQAQLQQAQFQQTQFQQSQGQMGAEPMQIIQPMNKLHHRPAQTAQAPHPDTPHYTPNHAAGLPSQHQPRPGQVTRDDEDVGTHVVMPVVSPPIPPDHSNLRAMTALGAINRNPCGNCPACQEQNKWRPNKPNNPHLVRIPGLPKQMSPPPAVGTSNRRMIPDMNNNFPLFPPATAPAMVNNNNNVKAPATRGAKPAKVKPVKKVGSVTAPKTKS